jgi:hypothetical protein
MTLRRIIVLVLALWLALSVLAFVLWSWPGGEGPDKVEPVMVTR